MPDPVLSPTLSLEHCQERCLQLPGRPHTCWGLRANETPKSHGQIKAAPAVTGSLHGEWSRLPCAAWLLMGAPSLVLHLLEVVLALGGSRAPSSAILAPPLHVGLGCL